jgi:hypothetical protein
LKSLSISSGRQSQGRRGWIELPEQASLIYGFQVEISGWDLAAMKWILDYRIGFSGGIQIVGAAAAAGSRQKVMWDQDGTPKLKIGGVSSV